MTNFNRQTLANLTLHFDKLLHLYDVCQYGRPSFQTRAISEFVCCWSHLAATDADESSLLQLEVIDDPLTFIEELLTAVHLELHGVKSYDEMTFVWDEHTLAAVRDTADFMAEIKLALQAFDDGDLDLACELVSDIDFAYYHLAWPIDRFQMHLMRKLPDVHYARALLTDLLRQTTNQPTNQPMSNLIKFTAIASAFAVAAAAAMAPVQSAEVIRSTCTNPRTGYSYRCMVAVQKQSCTTVTTRVSETKTISKTSCVEGYRREVKW